MSSRHPRLLLPLLCSLACSSPPALERDGAVDASRGVRDAAQTTADASADADRAFVPADGDRYITSSALVP